MKWTKQELLRTEQKVEFDEDIAIDPSVFANNSRIIAVEDVHVSGSGWLDEVNDRFYADICITGIMICPDAISNEEIEVPFETDSQETYAFEDTDEDGVRVVIDEVIEILPAVIEDILLEVPLQVTTLAEDEYPEGDGWKVYSEAEYQKAKEREIDPRFAALMQFRNEEQEVSEDGSTAEKELKDKKG